METELVKNNIIAAFDFDGVVHSYDSGWQGIDVISDPPVTAVVNAINRLRKQGVKVVIYSTRCREEAGREAIREWLEEHDIRVDDIVAEKPVAFCYIDDRAINYHGQSGDHLYDEINNFVSWREFPAPWGVNEE